MDGRLYPNLVAAIWIGYDQTDREHYFQATVQEMWCHFQRNHERVIPHLQKETFNVLSVNDQLAGKVQTREEIKKQAEKISKELNENAKKLGEKLQEQAPSLKKGFEDACFQLEKVLIRIIQKLKSLNE